MFRRQRILFAVLTVLAVSPLLGAQGAQQGRAGGGLAAPQGDAALVVRARAIHERVITLDTHNDISPNNFQWSRNYTQDLGNQVNLPKMKAGGLDVSFMIVYVGQSSGPDAFTPEGFQRAYDQAFEKFEAV